MRGQWGRLLQGAIYPKADFVAMVRDMAAAVTQELAVRPRYQRMAMPGVPLSAAPDTGLQRDGRTLRLVLSAVETNAVLTDATHPLGWHVDQPLLYSFLGDFDSLSMPEGWSVPGTAGCNRAGANPRTHELEMETMVARGRLMMRLVCGRTSRERRHANRLLSHFRHFLLEQSRNLLSVSRAQPA